MGIEFKFNTLNVIFKTKNNQFIGFAPHGHQLGDGCVGLGRERGLQAGEVTRRPGRLAALCPRLRLFFEGVGGGFELITQFRMKGHDNPTNKRTDKKRVSMAAASMLSSSPAAT